MHRYVERVIDVLNLVGIALDHRDIVLFRRKHPRKVESHLAVL